VDRYGTADDFNSTVSCSLKEEIDMLWKCSVCGFVHEGADAPDVCPKCGAPKEKFVALSEEDAKKIFASDRTNDIHMEIINLAMKIKDLANEGIAINLDPPCVAAFKNAKDEAWVIKQRSKAELAGHVGKGKW
jgi:rubredoxin